MIQQQKTVNKAMLGLKNVNLIGSKFSNGLKVEYSIMTRFCIQPKLYKTRNPGRLVTSSGNFHTTKNSEYVFENNLETL